MGRPPLKVGTWGDIRCRRLTTDGVKPERWKAFAQFRDLDGHTRQVSRTHSSDAKARNQLRGDLAERAKHAVVDADTSFADYAALWLQAMVGEVADSSHDRYRCRLGSVILPRLGGLRLRECTPGAMSRFLAELKADGHSAASRQSMRTVVSGVLQMAVEHDLIPTNTIRGIRVTGGVGRKATAYDAATVLDFLARLDGDRKARRADLPDLVRFLFGTGVRFGEALAVRWRNLNLSDEPVTVSGQVIPPRSVWVNGNLVHVTGKGIVRHDIKTHRDRTLGLPGFLHTMLMVRLDDLCGPNDPVFPSEVGGWRAPSNVQRAVRAARQRIDYPEFTTHIGRKTVATLLDQGGQSARQIADQLGHTQPSMTQNTYMGRGLANPDAAAALDAAHRSPAT